MREGFDETLTLQRLGVAGALYRKLRSTKALERIEAEDEALARRVA